MASLTAIEMLLVRLREKLLTHPAFTRFDGGPTVEDPSYEREWDELNEIGKKLALALRDLRNKENLTAIQVRNAARGPLEQRFRAASIQGGAHNQRALIAMAREIQKVLESVVLRNSDLGKAETAHQLADFIEKAFKQAQAQTHTGTLDVSHELHYSPYHPQSEGGSVEGLTFAIFMLIRVLDYLRKKH